MPFLIDDALYAAAAAAAAKAATAGATTAALGTVAAPAATAATTGAGLAGAGGLAASAAPVAGALQGGLAAAPAIEGITAYAPAAAGGLSAGEALGGAGIIGGAVGLNSLGLPGATYQEAGMYADSVQPGGEDSAVGDQSWWRQKLADYDAYMEANPKTEFALKRGIPAISAGFEGNQAMSPGETEVNNVGGTPLGGAPRRAPSTIGTSGRMPAMGAGRVPYTGPGSGMRRPRRRIYRR